MEKIYMQEEQQSSKQKLSKMSRISIGLSFFVAVFAVVSLIAAGFNNLSYAAPAITGDFTFRQAESSNQAVFIIGETNGGSTFQVPVYLTNSTTFGDANATPFFCIEAGVDIPNTSGTEAELKYVQDHALEDIGLLYILNKSRVLNENVAGIVPRSDSISTTGDTDKAYQAIETYATQVAIWSYLYQKNPTDAKHALARGGKTSEEVFNIIKEANALDVPLLGIGADFNGRSIYNTYIASVVSAAQSYTGVKKLTVTKADNTISKVGDDDWYQSSEITVAGDPSDDLLSYKVTLSGVEGAIVVGEDQNEKDTFAKGEKFWVRVPANKVSQETSRVTVTVTGTFNNYLTGTVYKNDANNDLQKVITVTGKTGTESSQLTLDFIGAPDTGMSKAQTIYFIGLIVLLCGVGIIYANAKPVQIEE